MNKKYVFMCVGYTHTGKTTFAKKLVKKYPNMIQLDSDEVAVFTKEKYPLLTIKIDQILEVLKWLFLRMFIIFA